MAGSTLRRKPWAKGPEKDDGCWILCAKNATPSGLTFIITYQHRRLLENAIIIINTKNIWTYQRSLFWTNQVFVCLSADHNSLLPHLQLNVTHLQTSSPAFTSTSACFPDMLCAQVVTAQAQAQTQWLVSNLNIKHLSVEESSTNNAIVLSFSSVGWLCCYSLYMFFFCTAMEFGILTISLLIEMYRSPQFHP